MKTILAVLSLFGSVAFAADVTAVKIKALDGFGGDLRHFRLLEATGKGKCCQGAGEDCSFHEIAFIICSKF